MKTYTDTTTPTRLVIPTFQYYPVDPVDGEVLIIKSPDGTDKGIRYYDSDEERWVPLFSTVSNIWETQVCTTEQFMFELENVYNTDGKSINVYVDGVRLPSNRVTEINNKTIIIKETYDESDNPVYLAEGQVIEFQIFNRRL
jgi:hypothetical protein